MRHLEIADFGPIEHISMDLKRVNVIIGPQSSGKSTVLKVACFCSWLERQIMLSAQPEKFFSQQTIEERLLRFYRMTSFMTADTLIAYRNDALSFSYSAKSQKWTFEWDKKRWAYKRPKIAYIPAERNLVSAIPNWYQVSMRDDNMLDFMQEWESARKSFVKAERILNLPAKYLYDATTQEDGIQLMDGQKIDLSESSSGLQSMTPLYIMLRYLTGDYYKNGQSSVEEKMTKERLMAVLMSEKKGLGEEKAQKTVGDMVTPKHSDLYIEEPEAHIFPSTQKEFVYSLVGMLNGQRKHSCFVSTHSPYVLTSLNNMILAGETLAEKGEAMKLFPKRQTIRYDEVAAYSMKNGVATDIMDNEYHLISAETIDEAFVEIGANVDVCAITKGINRDNLLTKSHRQK